MSRDEDFAFPLATSLRTQTGLTKRELFAAMAMQGLVTRVGRDENLVKSYPTYQLHIVDIMAANAVSAADALIAELEK